MNEAEKKDMRKVLVDAAAVMFKNCNPAPEWITHGQMQGVCTLIAAITTPNGMGSLTDVEIEIHEAMLAAKHDAQVQAAVENVLEETRDNSPRFAVETAVRVGIEIGKGRA